ncbi:MAG TPA: CBS domain-containing protein [Bacteroidia bacterium]|jgi:acetoin utilization protein AcuB|nr:CBS domain-containing protein [Bacteroidia bacterium]
MLLARDLITDTLPSIKTSDNATRVLEWMSEFKVAQLPVVSQERLLGIVTEEDLLNSGVEDLPVGAIHLSLPEKTFVYEDSHFYEVLKMASLMKLEILPVLSSRENNSFVGTITKSDLLKRAAEYLCVEEPGGIIVLHLANNNYSISEIGRICESNDAKVLSLSVGNSTEAGKLYVTIKLNVRELSRVIATFERFEYEIALVIFDAEQINDFRDSYENLLRYLNL